MPIVDNIRARSLRVLSNIWTRWLTIRAQFDDRCIPGNYSRTLICQAFCFIQRWVGRSRAFQTDKTLAVIFAWTQDQIAIKIMPSDLILVSIRLFILALFWANSRAGDRSVRVSWGAHSTSAFRTRLSCSRVCYFLTHEAFQILNISQNGPWRQSRPSSVGVWKIWHSVWSRLRRRRDHSRHIGTLGWRNRRYPHRRTFARHWRQQTHPECE